MNPLRNVAALATRDSVASTLAAVAERLAHHLNGRRCAARPLTGVELGEMGTALLAGFQPPSRWPGWRYLKHLNGCVTSFWVSPRDITSDTLQRLWLPDTDATVVTVRVVADHDGTKSQLGSAITATTGCRRKYGTG
jgi:type VII secretion protein EccE